MFTKSGGKVIESDTGFAVEICIPVGLRYTELGKTMEVDSEVLAGPSGLVVYSRSIKSWEPPHHNEPIDADARRRIMDNIRDAIRFEGFNAQIL